MYFVIEDIIDTTGTDIITAYELVNGSLARDVNGRITRAELIALLTYEPASLLNYTITNVDAVSFLYNDVSNTTVLLNNQINNITNTASIDTELLNALNVAQTFKTYSSLMEYFADTNAKTKLYVFVRMMGTPQIQPDELLIGQISAPIVPTLVQYNTWKLLLSQFDFSQFTYDDLVINLTFTTEDAYFPV
jgi:hypothetical protein